MFRGYLKQSTASQSRMIGPFVDETDGFTAETGLTIANTDIKLNKNGAAGVNKNSGGGTHRNNGNYSVTFDATDTDTVGELYFSVVVAGARQVSGHFIVLEEAVYDAMFATSAPGPVTASSRAEPAQGNPPATTDVATKVDYLYKAWRNKKTQTATEQKIFADDGTTVDHKATVSDDGTTATITEKVTGP